MMNSWKTMAGHSRLEEMPDFKDWFFVLLARPENAENIGLVARAMKNTGFRQLRIVGGEGPGPKSFVTAVHSRGILTQAALFPDLCAATADLHVIFASTAKARKNFSGVPLEKAVPKMLSFSPWTKIGLVFGNERTGLTSEELRVSNFRFTIPQASRQPSYNLAAAVLITLFEIFRRGPEAGRGTSLLAKDTPIPHREQEECLRRILQKLEERKFIHSTNKQHITDLISDLLGRLTMTDRDRKLLLALFSEVGQSPRDHSF
jgi:tRNA/rRNA methyltransferase